MFSTLWVRAGFFAPMIPPLTEGSSFEYGCVAASFIILSNTV
jgi:hypothetical protein